MLSITRKTIVAAIAMLAVIGYVLFPPAEGLREVLASGSTYHVSTTGNDTTGDGSSLNPWRTISKAASVAAAGDTVVIGNGTYRETVIPANSGTSGNPIVYQAALGATVTLSGTEPIVSGWTQYAGNIYRTTATLDQGAGNQIFVNGEMMIEARWPNSSGANWMLEPTFATADSGTRSGSYSLTDSDIPSEDWVGAHIFYSPKPTHGWSAWTGVITGMIGTTLQISTVFNPLWEDANGPKAGGHYYLFGKLAALDAEKEWFYDSSAAQLYLYQPGGGAPGSGTVEYKVRQNGFDLSGLSYIALENIDLFATSILMDMDSSHITIDSMTARYISHYSTDDDTMDRENTTGIVLSGTYNEIKNSEIAYSAGNGIVLSGSWNRIVNNYIHDINYLGIYCAPINLGGHHQMISHNTLTRAGRSLLTTLPLSFYNSKIQYNDLSASGYLTNDLGLFYIGGQQFENTEFHHNVLRDNSAHGGIYPDNHSHGVIIHHNVVYDNGTSSFISPLQLNGPQEYTLIYNNTLYNKGEIAGYYFAKHAGDMIGTQIYNNIAPDGIPESQAEVLYGFNHSSSSPGPGFVNAGARDLRLAEGSPNIDSGKVIPGITDGYVGAAPDKGAYEYGGSSWTAGHNFSADPNPVFSEVDTLYMNRVKNPGFDRGTMDEWSKTGVQTAELTQDTTLAYWYGTDGVTNTGTFAAKLGNGVNGLEQTVSNLIPNSRYRITAWVKVDNGEISVLGVKNFGGSDVTVSQTTSSHWVRKELTFTTGSAATSATVYLNKTSSGSGGVYWDDIGLQYQESALQQAVWKLDNDANDSSGNGFNGTNHGGTFTAGVLGNAISLNGSSQYVSVPDADGLDFGVPGNGFTISAWIKTTSPNARILAKGRPNANANIDYILELNAGKLKAWRWHQSLEQEDAVYDSDGAALNDGAWHHVAFVNENASSHKLYVDGQLVETSTAAWSNYNANGEPLYIGRYKNYVYSDEYFNGQIDEVKLFQRALDASEMLSESLSMIFGVWSFENNANDSSGNGFNGTNHGGAFTAGVLGNAISLNGSSQYVSIPDAVGLDFGMPSNDFTVSAWIKTTSANARILAKGRPNANANIDYILELNAGKLKAWRWHQSPDQEDAVYDSDGAALNDGAWHHVAFVNENASSHKLYVDGQLVETSTATWSNYNANSEPLYIGRYKNYVYSDEYFNGQIDEVKLFQRALDASEILSESVYMIAGVWSFENNANDSSGNGFNGANHGGAFTAGVSGNAISLNGSSQYVSVPDADGLDFGTPSNGFTISAWIKTTSANARILAKGRPNANADIDYILELNAGKLKAWRWHQSLEQEDAVYDSDGAALNDGAWHHVAFVNENALSHKLYVDGQLVETGTAAWSNYNANGEPLYIGRYKNYVYSDEYFNGQIDEVKLFQRSLDASLIQFLANIDD